MKILKNHRMKNLGGGGNSDKIASVLFPLNDNLQEKVLITLDKTCHLNDFCFAQIRIQTYVSLQRNACELFQVDSLPAEPGVSWGCFTWF